MYRTITLILFFLGYSLFAICQKEDTLMITSTPDTLSGKPKLRAVSFIIPAVLTGYGVLAIGDGPLTDLNYSTKNELQEDRPFFKSAIDNYAQYAPAAAVFGLQAFGIKGKNSVKDEAVIYATAMAINAAVVYPVKKFTAQMRPDSSTANSFPSGHTATAFVAAEFLRKEYGGVSPWYGIGGYLVATGTGVFRMLNNRHWLGDIAAGAGIGIASVKLSYFIHDRIRWKRSFLSNTIVAPYYQNKNTGLVLCKSF